MHLLGFVLIALADLISAFRRQIRVLSVSISGEEYGLLRESLACGYLIFAERLSVREEEKHTVEIHYMQMVAELARDRAGLETFENLVFPPAHVIGKGR